MRHIEQERLKSAWRQLTGRHSQLNDFDDYDQFVEEYEQLQFGIRDDGIGFWLTRKDGSQNYGPANLSVVEIAHDGSWDSVIEPAFGGEGNG